jgi:hypothetical protein
VLDGVSNGTSVMNVCQLAADQPANFPKSGSMSQHRMMLTVSRGALLFHLRLYDHFSYTGILILKLPSELAASFATRRVVVDYEDQGIREVALWPSG